MIENARSRSARSTPNCSSRSGARGAASGMRVREWRSSTRISPSEKETVRPSFSRLSETAERKFESGRYVSRHRSSNCSRATGASKISSSRGPSGTPSRSSTRQPRPPRVTRRAQRGVSVSPGAQRRRTRKGKADVADPFLPVERHQQRGVIEVRLDPAERDTAVERQVGQKRLKRRDARETGAAGAGVQMLGPEELRPARLLGRFGNLGVAHDLRGRLEWDYAR